MVESGADNDSLRGAVLDGHHPTAVALHHGLALPLCMGEDIHAQTGKTARRVGVIH